MVRYFRLVRHFEFQFFGYNTQNIYQTPDFAKKNPVTFGNYSVPTTYSCKVSICPPPPIYSYTHWTIS